MRIHNNPPGYENTYKTYIIVVPAGSNFAANVLDVIGDLGREAVSVFFRVMNDQDIYVKFNDITYDSWPIPGRTTWELEDRSDTFRISKIYLDNTGSGCVDAIVHIWVN